MRALPPLLAPLLLAHPLLAHPLPALAVAAPALRPPVTPACISSPFGWRGPVGPRAPAGFHNGVDLPAPAGALVHAAADGTVVAIRRQGLGGVTVHLAHPGGTRTLYAHLGNLVPAIAEGRREVRAGEPLGHVARTGVTYGAHVFFAVLRGQEAIDPEPLLGVPRCRPPPTPPPTPPAAAARVRPAAAAPAALPGASRGPPSPPPPSP